MRNCNADREVKLLEHAMKIIERVLERRIRELLNIDSMPFDFYAWKRNDRRIVCCAKNARGI